MPTLPLPPIVALPDIAKSLHEIFPAGTPNRNYVIREMAARTLFVMFYVGAVEGTGRWLRPDQITKMTTRQAAKTDSDARNKWAADSLMPGKLKNLVERWYAPNTREPIRDETLRSGLVAVGAVVERTDLPTTSAKPRYAIARDFADLLIRLSHDPADSQELVEQWRLRHLTASALSRITLLRAGTVRASSTERVIVTFPNGDTCSMHPGPSTTISKAVIEQFAPRFLREPGVVFLSESGAKVIRRHDELARALRLDLDYSRNLPDIIVADIDARSPKLVFVEVVATDGAITERRKQALLRVATDAGYETATVYFVTAFLDRSATAFRKLVSEIAWETFVWFVAEPDKLLAFRGGKTSELSSLFSQ